MKARIVKAEWYPYYYLDASEDADAFEIPDSLSVELDWAAIELRRIQAKIKKIYDENNKSN